MSKGPTVGFGAAEGEAGCAEGRGAEPTAEAMGCNEGTETRTSGRAVLASAIGVADDGATVAIPIVGVGEAAGTAKTGSGAATAA